MTGTEERLATGDAVNVAARLEQAAQPGEILIGEETLALVRDAVEIEPVEPLELKGKAEPVPAHRLVTVHEAPERRHEMPFVGRSSELESLQKAWRRALEERRCELVTVVGDAGVGKSRLAAEFLDCRSRPQSSRGRCLPYGEGITYWPVVEVVKQLDALPSDPAAAASIRSLLGETEEGTSAEEIAWAFRKLLEEQARRWCRVRRHPVGRGDVPRPRRAGRAAVVGGADSAPLHGAPRAARPPLRLARLGSARALGRRSRR